MRGTEICSWGEVFWKKTALIPGVLRPPKPGDKLIIPGEISFSAAKCEGTDFRCGGRGTEACGEREADATEWQLETGCQLKVKRRPRRITRVKLGVKSWQELARNKGRLSK